MKRLRPTNEHSLESLKFFPVVAWMLVIGFAAFVGHITIELTNATKDIAVQSQLFEDEFNKPLKRATSTSSR